MKLLGLLFLFIVVTAICTMQGCAHFYTDEQELAKNFIDKCDKRCNGERRGFGVALSKGQQEDDYGYKCNCD